MPPSHPPSKEPLSYYAKRAHWISSTVPTTPLSEELKTLLTCFLTIKDIRDFLFDPKVNLATNIKNKFINDILLVDFGKVIVGLRDYRGAERKGIKEALERMNEALDKLYKAYTAKDNAKAQQLRACRDKLQEAYLLLERLEKTVKKHFNSW